MAATNLKCRECGTQYPLEALYVCERCFGPLEVAYDHDRANLDVGELRRRIQGGPQNIWRYADFLPLAGGPPGPSARLASRVGLPAGCTPLIRADRLAQRLGLREVWVKNDAANPTHSFKDRVVSVAVTRARELGFETIACASTGNLANSVAAHGAGP
jgi:threonine synthase